MAVEIECKVQIAQKDIGSLFPLIDAFMEGVEFQHIDKKDAYYSTKNDSHTLFRIRQVEDQTIITRKIKESRNDGIEVNQEIDFTAPFQSSIHAFFTSLGYSVVIEKEKTGYSWTKGNLTIELVEVAPLGWFLEIEVLIQENEDKELATRQLAHIRKALGIDSLELVSEYYNDMLKKIRI